MEGVPFTPPDSNYGIQHTIGSGYEIYRDPPYEYHIFEGAGPIYRRGDKRSLDRMYVFRIQEADRRAFGVTQPTSSTNNTGRTGLDLEVYARK